MMKFDRKFLGLALFLVFPAMSICRYSVALDRGATDSLYFNSLRPKQVPAEIPKKVSVNFQDPSAAGAGSRPGQHHFARQGQAKTCRVKGAENTLRPLKEILRIHYKGSEFVNQQLAFERILDWKEDFNGIAEKYANLDWKILCATIKAETQGRSGAQVSHAKAIGIAQIKYQGAWAFLWDAMFSKKIKQGTGLTPDYYNFYIRQRYNQQLSQIKRYLETTCILVNPTAHSRSENEYRRARFESWNNLKVHLEREFKPGEYQVAVDIAALYMDHLINIVGKVKKQVSEIKQYVAHNDNIGFDDIAFLGVTMIRWQRIKKHLVKKDDELRANANRHAETLAYLADILEKLADPNIYSAAYNFGIRKVIEYIKAGKDLPAAIGRYVETVSQYKAILNQIETCRAGV
jgi:hypothetical protein